MAQLTTPRGRTVRVITFSRSFQRAAAAEGSDIPFWTELMCPACAAGFSSGHPLCDDMYRAQGAWKAREIMYLEERGFQVHDFGAGTGSSGDAEGGGQGR